MEFLYNDIGATFATFIVCIIWLKFNEVLAAQKVVSSKTCRKFVHIGTGPIYLLCWRMFSDSFLARVLASLVPGMITINFALIGLRIIKDENTVKSMSRSGNPRELLLGPFAYGVIHVISTIVYWKSSIVGIIALMLLCMGDGFAGLIGQQFGKERLPWNKEKTWIGTISFAILSFISSLIYINIFASWGYIDILPSQLFSHLTIVILLSAVIESLPILDWDNITVFLTAIVTLTFLGY